MVKDKSPESKKISRRSMPEDSTCRDLLKLARVMGGTLDGCYYNDITNLLKGGAEVIYLNKLLSKDRLGLLSEYDHLLSYYGCQFRAKTYDKFEER